MRSSNKLSAIALLGIHGHERWVVQTICLLSKDALYTYVLHDEASSEAPDIVIVDRDNPDAMAVWRQFKRRAPMTPAVMLTHRPSAGLSEYELGRPLMATRLRRLLEEIQRNRQPPAITLAKQGGTSERTLVGEPLVTRRSNSGANQQPAQLAALIVDDSFAIRRQSALKLAPFVNSIDLAEDGEQAVKYIASRRYGIIFLDVVLPGMNGYETCRQIKREKSTRRTPVIILTGKTSPFDRVKGKLAGCDTYLTDLPTHRSPKSQ